MLVENNQKDKKKSQHWSTVCTFELFSGTEDHWGARLELDCAYLKIGNCGKPLVHARGVL